MNQTHPRRIVIEVRKDPIAAEPLKVIARVCEALGHEVIYWRGPLSGRMPYSRWMPVCDLAILYNGAHRSYRPALARLHAWGAATLFVEMGWYPQAGHFQIDPVGVNAAASWSQQPLPKPSSAAKLDVRSAGDLLVLMQLDGDTQITERSPWFSNMFDFVRFLGHHSQLPLRLRLHPKARLSAAAQTEIESLGIERDTSSNLRESLARSRAVACINSSAAVEAMDQKLPVLCYGESIYRHAGAVYCLTGDGDQTRLVTSELAAGRCELIAENVAAAVRRVREQQWTVSRIENDLPSTIDRLLNATPAIEPRLTSSNRLEQAILWLADLPARVLYRRRARMSPTSLS